jgi:hypothetical protein
MELTSIPTQEQVTSVCDQFMTHSVNFGTLFVCALATFHNLHFMSLSYLHANQRNGDAAHDGLHAHSFVPLRAEPPILATLTFATIAHVPSSSCSNECSHFAALVPFLPKLVDEALERTEFLPPDDIDCVSAALSFFRSSSTSPALRVAAGHLARHHQVKFYSLPTLPHTVTDTHNRRAKETALAVDEIKQVPPHSRRWESPTMARAPTQAQETAQAQPQAQVQAQVQAVTEATVAHKNLRH